MKKINTMLAVLIMTVLAAFPVMADIADPGILPGGRKSHTWIYILAVAVIIVAVAVLIYKKKRK